jgi:hypothetical protein
MLRAMTRLRAVRAVSVACSLGCSVVLGCASATGRTFLEDKTGIGFRGPTSVCAASVVDNEDCRPQSFGSGQWQKNSNFPPYSASESAVRDGYQSVVAEVRAHYLGSPFYEGDVHAVCKQGVPSDAIPPEGTSLQDYDLATMLEDTAVRDLTRQLKIALDARAISASTEITNRFRTQLVKEVKAKVQARLLWFVARYPGGRADIAKNEKLRSCVEEQKGNVEASLVTGVAGYIVLDNRIDSAIASEATVVQALEVALAGQPDTVDPDIKMHLASTWTQSVDKVAQIKSARRDLTTMAWPLWVQFQ